jgi:hypothetical protein
MPTETYKPFKADWKNPSLYPPVGCQDPHRIAWEFVRRHPDYVNHAAQMCLLVQSGEYETGIKRNSPSVLDGVECWPAAKPSETAIDYFARMKKDKIKRPRIDKPCNSFANRWALKTPVDPDLENYSPEQVVFIKNDVKTKRHEQLETKVFRLFIYANEIAVRFRLDLRIEPQIRMASKKLKAIAKGYSTDVSTARETQRDRFASIAKKELPQDIFDRAHYILRSYDARKKSKASLSNADNDKSALKSFPEQTRLFNAQQKILGKDYFEVTKVKMFPQQAANFIVGKKFLLLLWPEKNNNQKITPCSMMV